MTIDEKRFPMTAVAWMRCEHEARRAHPSLKAIEDSGRNLTERDIAALDCENIVLTGLRRRYREAAAAEKYPIRLFDWDSPHYTTARVKPGLRAANSIGGTPAIYLYGDLGEKYGGVTAEEFQRQLAKIPDSSPLNLHVHSGGGSYTDGVAIYTMLKRRAGKVVCTVDGLAASAASLITMAADEIAISRGAWIMIHESRAGIGDSARASDFEDAAARLREVNSQIVAIYSDRWKGTIAELQSALAAETWYGANEAVAVGLADYVSEQVAIAARFDESRYDYSRIPSELSISALCDRDRNAFARRRAGLYLHRIM
jgi:ATP-dependent protease ClpP protease subunit